MINTRDRFKNKKPSQKGASLVEYALLVALISIISIVSIQKLGVNVYCRFDQIAQALERNGAPWSPSGVCEPPSPIIIVTS